MAMGALNGQKDRSVRALEAGADIVLVPIDPRAAHSRIVEKMKQDLVFRKRVEDAAEKVKQLLEH
jgi:beta-N-acetylhexosaminidase